jgi:hypothetical protein
MGWRVLCCLRAEDLVRPTGGGRHGLAVLCCLRAVDLVRPTGTEETKRQVGGFWVKERKAVH